MRGIVGVKKTITEFIEKVSKTSFIILDSPYIILKNGFSKKFKKANEAMKISK